MGKDVDLKYIQSGKSVASFTLAVSDNFNKEKTHWINCTVWGKQAESCSQYIGKGSLVAVDGRINTRDYENNEGRKVYITEVVADSVQFLDSKKSGDKSVDKPNDTSWDDIGKEIKLEDMNLPDDEEAPF